MQKLGPISKTLKIYTNKYIFMYEYAYLHMTYEYGVCILNTRSLF